MQQTKFARHGANGAIGEIGHQMAQALGFQWLAYVGKENDLALCRRKPVIQRRRFAAVARDALAKIAAVLPAELRESLDASTLLLGPGKPLVRSHIDLPALRRAIRNERKLSVTYRDVNGVESTRTLWPFALAFMDNVDLVVAWCEMRRDFRHFRADRIASLQVLDERYPRRRAALLKEWRSLREAADEAADRN